MDKLNKVTQPGSGDKYSYMALKFILLTTTQMDFPFLLGLLFLFSFGTLWPLILFSQKSTNNKCLRGCG